jgi:outer membrane protein TolC
MRMPSETDALTGRVGLTWPRAPWTRGRAEAMRREAAARRTAAEAGARAMANDLSRLVQEAHARAEAAAARADLIRSRLMPRTQHVLDLTLLGYQADRGDVLDVVDATRAVVDLERDLVQADGARWLAVVALERALGTRLSSLAPASTR